MEYTQAQPTFIDINQLITCTGMSRATIWRLKKAGKIPFVQPGGKGSVVRFPKNAIEQLQHRESVTPVIEREDISEKRLPGPRPAWQRNSRP